MTDQLKDFFGMNSATAVEIEEVVQRNTKKESNKDFICNGRAADQVHVEELQSDSNTGWNVWNETKVITSIATIAQALGSTLGSVAYCVKSHDKNKAVKSGKIAVIVESDGTQTTEEVVWKETHHKDSHSGLSAAAANNATVCKPTCSKSTQPSANKNGSTK